MDKSRRYFFIQKLYTFKVRPEIRPGFSVVLGSLEQHCFVTCDLMVPGGKTWKPIQHNYITLLLQAYAVDRTFSLIQCLKVFI